MNQRIDVLIVGDAQRQLVVACENADARWRSAATIDDALSLLAEAPFDLIVLNCDRRGIFSPDSILRLAHCAPLTRIVAVTGPWCEGPWRRGADLLPGANLVPWHRFRAWLMTSAGQMRRGIPAAWSLPLAAAVDEMAEFWSRSAVPQGQGLVTIDSTNRDAADAISDALNLAGYSSTWHVDTVDALTRGAVAVVMDANAWNEAVAMRIGQLQERYNPAPVFLALNFPLPADISAALSAGAATVIAKPFTLGEFWGQLNELIPPSRVAAGEAA